MSVAANNIANANSPGYQTEQAVTTDTPGGGTTATITSIPGPDNVETQLANLKQAAFLYTANGAVISAAAHITGTLLDILDNNSDYNDRHDPNS
jgi:flagellar basal body rod protein FlgC